MNVAETLKSAREAMVERGRCRLNLINAQGNVCLLGSIGVALEGDRFGDNDWYLVEGSGPGAEAVRELASHIGYCSEEDDPIQTVYMFNDDTKTTDQDVLDLFDKALADLGAMAE